jgi:hypothetical protein
MGWHHSALVQRPDQWILICSHHQLQLTPWNLVSVPCVPGSWESGQSSSQARIWSKASCHKASVSSRPTVRFMPPRFLGPPADKSALQTRIRLSRRCTITDAIRDGVLWSCRLDCITGMFGGLYNVTSLQWCQSIFVRSLKRKGPHREFLNRVELR